MKSLADLKRRLTIGTILEMTYHRYAGDVPVEGNLGRTVVKTKKLVGTKRPISIIQTNAIALKTEGGKDSWLYWPKAKEIRIDGPDAFSILEDGLPLMSYTIHPAP